MGKIYKSYGSYYKKAQTGKGRFRGMFLWKPVKKFLFFWIPDRTRRSFWLDDYGFEKA